MLAAYAELVADPEEPLTGGAVSGPVRIGDTVRRPAGSAAVHRVLRHLERAGFDGAPRLLGTDEMGRDILTFIPGTVLPGQSMDDAALASAAHLIRRYHDAVDGLEVEGFEAPIGGAGRIACHNDLSPRNTIYRDGFAVALVDWDFVGMGPPLWDVAHAVWQFVLAEGPSSPEPARRLRLFVDAYGRLTGPDRSNLLAAVVARMLASADGIDRRAALGQPAFARLARAGAAETIRAHAAWVAQWKP
jgi:Phosphotransferase enzyme family